MKNGIWNFSRKLLTKIRQHPIGTIGCIIVILIRLWVKWCCYRGCYLTDIIMWKLFSFILLFIALLSIVLWSRLKKYFMKRLKK